MQSANAASGATVIEGPDGRTLSFDDDGPLRAAWYPVCRANRNAATPPQLLGVMLDSSRHVARATKRDSKGATASIRTAHHNGLMWACVADAADAALPPIDIDGFTSDQIIISNKVDVFGDFDQAALGLVDPAHVPMVHTSWWWRPSARARREKAKQYAPSPFGFTATPHDDRKPAALYTLIGGAPEISIEFRLPALRIERVHAGENRLVNFSFITPVGPRHHHLQNVMFSNMSWLKAFRPLLWVMGQNFLQQDAAILNKIVSHAPTLGKTPMLFCGDPDKPSLWYFQCKRELARSGACEEQFRHPVTPQVLRWRT